MSEYLKELNPVQLKAVTHVDGPLLVVAGPGSGKTRVLTYRIAYLIEQGIPPWEILALTFTNKAAREMKTRIETVVGSKANRVWAGTFHSIFARILRMEAELIGYPANFTIYDTDDTSSLIGTIIKELNLDKTTYNVNAVRSRISSAKSNLIPPRAYEKREELLEEDRMSKRPHFHKIYTAYSARCKKAGAMDFDDLLYRLYELLHRNPENVLEKYRKKFRYLLVDEFQDTNYLQYAILRKLSVYDGSPRNVCVVGDDAQSIYAFRGATIQNILDFEKDFRDHGIRTYKLEQNYRSTDHIVKAANEVITYNKKQIPKTIWSSKGEGQRIKVIKAVSDAEEGKRVADAILEQKNRWHLANQDIAILYRTNAQSRVFEEHLRRYNIPYRIYGGLSFYQRKEVKDLVGYLRLAVNPRDEEALRRVINYPRRGIGDTTLAKVAAFAGSTEKTLFEALAEVPLNTRTQNALRDFRDLILDFEQKAKSLNAYEAATYIVRKSGLMDLLKEDNSMEGLGRLENITSLLDGIGEFVEDDLYVEGQDQADKSLASYLQNIALITDQDQQKDGGDFITLMSVHAAKGLEFKAIFLVGVEENIFPSFMSLESPEGLDEERRLFYVAITRAEQFLCLSFASSRYHYGSIRYNQPSRFLEEISTEHLEANAPIGPAHRGQIGVSDREGGAIGRPGSRETGRSGVRGNFRKPASRTTAPRIDPKDFTPSSSDQIRVGMKVRHLKFGEGKVISIDGGSNNKVATIYFDDIDNPQRRIMLRFAKLQILN